MSPPILVYDEESAENVREGNTVTTLPSTMSAPRFDPRPQTTRESKRQDDPGGQTLHSITIGSVLPKLLFPNPSTTPASGKDFGTNEPTSVEIEKILPSPSISVSKITIPQTTGVSTTLVPPNVPTYPGPTSPGAKPKTAEGPDKENLNSAIGSLVFLALYILATELQMRWNHLDGINSVNTTGQIIPLVLGCLSLIRSIYLLKDTNWYQGRVGSRRRSGRS